MTVETSNTLEDRIQKPAYLLFLVVVLLFLIIGLVDLIDHTSQNAAIFGRYSLKYFALIVAYTLLTLGWASLLLRPNNDRWLTATLDFIQQRPLLAVAILLAIGALLVAMLNRASRLHTILLDFPAMQATVMVILLLVAGLILFYNWGNPASPQLWRKIVAAALGFLLAVELILQLLTFLNVLPTMDSTLDGFAPYDRIYYNVEGSSNGIANNYGRYAERFELLPESERIAIAGGSAVQGLQVAKDEQLSWVLQQKLAESGAENSEVLNLGTPDLGPGLYISDLLNPLAIESFEPDQVIAIFDLGRDFQIVPAAGYDLPFYILDADGQVERVYDDYIGAWNDLHQYEHAVYEGYEGVHPLRLVGSHYLTPDYLRRLLGLQPQPLEFPLPAANPDIDLVNGFVFNETTNALALDIATGLVDIGRQQFNEAGASFSLVSLPVFSPEFYAQERWNTTFGGSDLLLPEAELRAYAAQHDMPFLGLGTYMAARGLSPADVRALYYNEGLSHLTPQGHAFVGEALYDCFYARSLTPEQGCDLPDGG